MKHEAITTHTFSTDDGIKIVVNFSGDHFDGATVQFPGSGNRAFQLIPSEVAELAEVAREANAFLNSQNVTGCRQVKPPEVLPIVMGDIG